MYLINNYGFILTPLYGTISINLKSLKKNRISQHSFFVIEKFPQSFLNKVGNGIISSLVES